jgi:anaerobic selenocysteine-containing dehydrogenase
MHNANQIFRTPAWRKTDPDGALRIHPDDIAALGGRDGGWMAVATRTGRIVCRVESDPSMRRGLVALPHGYGQSYPDGAGGRIVDGPRLKPHHSARRLRPDRRDALPQGIAVTWLGRRPRSRGRRSGVGAGSRGRNGAGERGMSERF